MGRAGRSSGNLFDGGEPEDAIPGLEDLIPGVHEDRRSGRSRSVGPIRGRSARSVTVRRGWLVLRLVLYTVLFLLGVLMMVSGAVTAASSYGEAATMAAAPQCPPGTDLAVETADCVGDLVVSAEGGVSEDDDEESLGLVLPARDGYYLWPTFPGDAAFAAVIGDDESYPVRVEFWQGNAVTLTAARGDDVQAVTTDDNPNNQAGTDVGVALMGLSFVDLAVLLVIGVRAIRYRWLRPGLGLRLAVSALIVGGFGMFVAAVCQVSQPARILLTMTVAPSVTAGVMLCVCLSVFSSRRRGHSGVRRRG
jgi:hypothetical protein